MLTLTAIGFVAGLVTALSPCVLPVLPGILAGASLTSGGAPGPPAGVGGRPAAGGTSTAVDVQTARTSRRRPYLIVAGLLTSFTLLTLLGATLVSALGVPDGLLRTESLAWALDRLCILQLKLYHLRIEAARADASTEHQDACGLRLGAAEVQHRELMLACASLWADLASGVVRYSPYRQFKLYNDPETNPALYGAQG